MVVDTLTTELPFSTTLRMLETYPNPFTAGNGERLYLIGAQQIKPDGGEFMKFVGTALTEGFVRGPLIPNQDIVSPVELTIILHEDGSIDSTFILGEEETIEESWPADPDAFRLVEFNGIYFLDKEYFSLALQ